MGLVYSACRSLLEGLVWAASGWEVRGRENVPRTGGLIVASNHISFFDPPLIGTAVVRELHFMAKEELFRPPLFGSLIRFFNAIPIRRGKVDVSGLNRALEVLQAGHALIVFPEGSRMRDGELHPARPGVGMLAVGSDAMVLPCFVSGTDHGRGWLLRRTRPRVTIGRPRTWRELAGGAANEPPGRTLYQAVGDAVMREIAALKAEQLNRVSRGAA